MSAFRNHPMLVRVVGAALVVEVVVFTATTVPGVRDSGFDVTIDGWLQGAAYVTTAILGILRPLTSTVNRRLWSWIAAALVARALAFVVFLTYVRTLDPQPFPSVADAFWLAMYPLIAAGLIAVAMRRSPGVAITVFLDGIVGACATGAVFLAALYETLHALAAPGTERSVLVTNLAYPILDVGLVLILLAVLITSEYRLSGQLWLLLGSVLGFAVGDSIYLYQAAAGTFRPGTLVSALSLVPTAMMAIAAWVSVKTPNRVPTQSIPGLALPGFFSLACLGVVVYGTQRHVATDAIVLATLGLLIAIARAALSFRDARAAAQAREDARTDELSGLPNRRAFHEHLERAVHGRPAHRALALLNLDLDQFKLINDTIGHHGGDAVLALVGPRLQLTLKEEDLLARVGGDEFAIVIEDKSASEVEQIAEQLRSNLRKPFTFGDDVFQIDVTVGIAMFPDDGRDTADLIARADVAMYDAKASGTGQGFYRAERHQSTEGRFEGYERLRQAIESDELVLHYQPQIALDTGSVVSVEALVRWQHPEYGLLPPARFLPAVEGGGLMRLMTVVVLERAVRQCVDWRAAGHEVSVAVNVSVTDLLDPDLPDQVSDLLKRFGLPPSSLALELTEDLSLTNRSQGKQMIAALVGHGVTVLIDDYGTGFSSLDYLRDLRGIGGLKLDRSFMNQVETDQRAQAIVRSTAALASSLDLRLIIEGVETAGQADLLPALGCHFAQGYYFARPAPPEAVDLGVIASAARS